MQWTEALWLRQLSGAMRTLGKHVKETPPRKTPEPSPKCIRITIEVKGRGVMVGLDKWPEGKL